MSSAPGSRRTTTRKARFHKKHTGLPSLTWTESVREALCFGWIDGVRRRIDDDSYFIRFTPPRPCSN